jgi:membrane fusion protein, heavy metal efflux system
MRDVSCQTDGESQVPEHLEPAQEGVPSRQVFSSIVTVALVLSAMTFFVVNAFEIPIPFLDRAGAQSVLPNESLTHGVELVKDVPNTLRVPSEVRISLGIRDQDGKDRIAEAKLPTHGRKLTMSGSTALDPTRIARIRPRFPAEVVAITKVVDHTLPTSYGQSNRRELRAGDHVNKGDVLAVYYSADVGNKKNDLIDALVQVKLDKEILERTEKAGGSVPDIFRLNARRNVEADQNAIARAYHTLKTWNIPDDDVKKVEAEAAEIIKREGVRDPKKTDSWARVELRAPEDGIIVERNVGVGDMVTDNTVALFQIAKVDRLLVTANASEEDLPSLLDYLNPNKKRDGNKLCTWRIRCSGTGDAGVEAPVGDISYIIDPSQHSAVVKGYIDNPDARLRGGQYITAEVELPPPDDVVEIPSSAIVDDGRQSIVFVQLPTNGSETLCSLRRVEVIYRLKNTTFVRSKPFAAGENLTAEEKETGLFPRQELRVGDRVLLTGALELKKALEDLSDTAK